MINSDANPDVAINIYRSSTNSMPEVNLKNLIGNKFADVVITRNGTSYSVGPRAGIEMCIRDSIEAAFSLSLWHKKVSYSFLLVRFIIS